MLAVLMLNRITTYRRKTMKKASARGKKTAVDYCRTCLSTDDLVSIFYSKETESKRSSQLMIVTGLDIKMNDGLSQKICTNCIETMNTALQFRRTSKKAEKTLLNMLTISKTKKKLTKPRKVSKPIDPDESCEKETEEKINTSDYKYDITLFGDDFQNDYDAPDDEEESKVKEKHLVSKDTPIPNASSYKCSTCSKEFKMKATYKAHMRFHTNYCVCESCGKRCRNNNQLQEHKRARHGLGRIHKCAFCEYSSATKEALIIHERRHTGERPYICDHCGATFHRRSNLVQHIAIHLPEKNFQCNVCPKREKSRKLLAIHQYKYHREHRYRYICPVCQDSFTRPGNVRQHLARTHNIAREHQGVIDKIEINLPIASEVRPQYTIVEYPQVQII